MSYGKTFYINLGACTVGRYGNGAFEDFGGSALEENFDAFGCFIGGNGCFHGSEGGVARSYGDGIGDVAAVHLEGECLLAIEAGREAEELVVD